MPKEHQPQQRQRCILVTGATGRIGGYVASQLEVQGDTNIIVIRCSRNPPVTTNKDKHVEELTATTACSAASTPQQLWVQWDVEQNIVPDVVMKNTVDAIFLMRPPQVNDPNLFDSLLRNLATNNRSIRNTRIVFLSVYGADQCPYLPHARLEKAILQYHRRDHVCFVRPTYFMENLWTEFGDELVSDRSITLPAADLSFNWAAAQDVAEIIVQALLLDDNVPSELPVTTPNQHSFWDVAHLLTTTIQAKEVPQAQTAEESPTTTVDIANLQPKKNTVIFTYNSVSIVRYCFWHWKRYHDVTKLLVMLLLHYLPRWGIGPGAVPVSTYSAIIGTSSELWLPKRGRFMTLKEWIENHMMQKDCWDSIVPFSKKKE